MEKGEGNEGGKGQLLLEEHRPDSGITAVPDTLTLLEHSVKVRPTF